VKHVQHFYIKFLRGSPWVLKTLKARNLVDVFFSSENAEKENTVWSLELALMVLLLLFKIYQNHFMPFNFTKIEFKKFSFLLTFSWGVNKLEFFYWDSDSFFRFKQLFAERRSLYHTLIKSIETKFDFINPHQRISHHKASKANAKKKKFQLSSFSKRGTLMAFLVLAKQFPYLASIFSKKEEWFHLKSWEMWRAEDG